MLPAWHTRASHVPVTCKGSTKSLIQALVNGTHSQGCSEQSSTSLPFSVWSFLHILPTPRILVALGKRQSHPYYSPVQKKEKEERNVITYAIYREQVKVYIHSQENPTGKMKQHLHPSRCGRESIGTWAEREGNTLLQAQQILFKLKATQTHKCFAAQPMAHPRLTSGHSLLIQLKPPQQPPKTPTVGPWL